IVLTAAMGTTQRLRATADSIQPILLQRAQAGNALTDTVALTITTDLGRQAQDAEMQANVAADSITALAFDGLPIFLWNSILYAAVVLFPWVLLLLFFYRKRK